MTSTGLGVDVYRVKNGKVLFEQLRNFKGQLDNEEMLKVLVESAIIDIDNLFSTSKQAYKYNRV